MKNYYFIIIALLCYSCNTSNKSDKYKDAERFTMQDIPETVSLTGKEIDFDEIIIPSRYFTIVDTVLVITNSQTEHVIHCFDVKNHKKVAEFVRRGNGPDDIVDPTNVQFVDTCIWIFDIQQQIIRQYGKLDIRLPISPKSLNSVRLKVFSNRALVLPEQDRFIASTIQPEKKRFILYNMEGNILNEFGDFPELIINTPMTPIEAIESFIGNLLYSNDKFIFVCNRTDLIEIYNFDGSLNKRLHGPDGFIPYLKQRDVGGGGVAAGGDRTRSREGYFSPVVYGNELWVMYDGRYSRDVDSAHLKNTIIVFNLDEGKPIRLIQLDKDILRFTIDEKNNVMYGISSDPEYHIVQFDLNMQKTP